MYRQRQKAIYKKISLSEYAAPFGELGLSALVDALSDSMDDVIEGDTKRCESMLLGQAYALQSIFTNLSRRAAKQERLKHYEVFLKLGLKAQSQCRATLETLTIMSNAWNPERRMRQAMLIQTWKPWRRATGPITDTGKRQNPLSMRIEGMIGTRCALLCND